MKRAFFALALAACTAAEPADDAEPLGTISQAATSGFRLPFKCKMSMPVTQGNNSGFSHTGEAAYGFDFGVPLNTPLVAAKGGRVSHARNDVKPGNPCYSGGGPGCISTLNYVTIDHGDGSSTLYAHLNSVSVKVGQVVAQGADVGLSGGTGWSTGPHTHLQRQQNCGAFVCQSIPMSFEDVPGSGVPVGGQTVRSQNACDGVDCALGDGHYCGGNGVSGDKNSLFLCTGGTAKVAETCAYGCKHMPAGTADRCATAAEAGDGGAGDAGSAAADPVDEGATQPGTDGDHPGHFEHGIALPEGEMPATGDGANADGCALAHAPSGGTQRAWPWLAAAALAFVARRRRRRAGVFRS